MTRQESFKKRVRARMAKTGERYGAARRVLLDQAAARAAATGRTWAAEPELANETVQDATGRGWEEWCDLIDAWPGHAQGHTAVASWLQREHGVDAWWSQSVTGGWERITGRRLPYQMADGTFTAGKSRTVTVDGEALRRLLLTDAERADLFPGHETVLRSRPASKVIRLGIGGGVALISIELLDDGRAKVSVAHEKLATIDDVDSWRFYWDEWLSAIDGTT